MTNSSNSNTSANFCIPGIVMKATLCPEKLSICSMNSQSICARKLSKLDELRQIFSISNVDVACICETWLREEIDDAILNIAGYKLIRNDRKGRVGGGIAIYLKKSIDFQVITKSSYDIGDPHTEYLITEVRVDNKKNLDSCILQPSWDRL